MKSEVYAWKEEAFGRNIRFADDVVVPCESEEQVTQTLQQVNDAC